MVQMLELFLSIIILVLIAVVIIFFLYARSLRERLSAMEFSKSSQSVKYGLLTEQWIPFSKKFPFPPQNFKFLGQPIDGIAFNDENIVFVEFKTATSSLNEKQRHIKQLIEDGKIKWLEFKIR